MSSKICCPEGLKRGFTTKVCDPEGLKISLSGLSDLELL